MLLIILYSTQLYFVLPHRTLLEAQMRIILSAQWVVMQSDRTLDKIDHAWTRRGWEVTVE